MSGLVLAYRLFITIGWGLLPFHLFAIWQMETPLPGWFVVVGSIAALGVISDTWSGKPDVH